MLRERGSKVLALTGIVCSLLTGKALGCTANECHQRVDPRYPQAETSMCTPLRLACRDSQPLQNVCLQTVFWRHWWQVWPETLS